jgi:hypothetical protein
MDRKRRILRGWKDRRLPQTEPVDEKAIRPTPTARIASKTLNDRILLKVSSGVMRAEADIGIGCQMEDDVKALHGVGYSPKIKQVAFNKLQVGRQ